MSSITATFSVSKRSCSAKTRPCWMGILSAAKYCGLTYPMAPCGPGSPGGDGRPSIWKDAEPPLPLNGMGTAAAAEVTPGIAARFPITARKNAIRLASRIGVTRGRQREARRDDAIGAEAGVDVFERGQAAQEQAGAYQQHQRQRHFRHHQGRAQMLAPEARGIGAASLFQKLVAVQARDLPSRRHSEDHPGRHRSQD